MILESVHDDARTTQAEDFLASDFGVRSGR